MFTWSRGMESDILLDATRLHKRAISSVVERLVHTEEVTGSNPVSPTAQILCFAGDLFFARRPVSLHPLPRTFLLLNPWATTVLPVALRGFGCSPGARTGLPYSFCSCFPVCLRQVGRRLLLGGHSPPNPRPLSFLPPHFLAKFLSLLLSALFSPLFSLYFSLSSLHFAEEKRGLSWG